TEAVCAACDNANGPYCKRGNTCEANSNAQCAKYCCDDTDCGPGKCFKADSTNVPVFTFATMVGVCVEGGAGGAGGASATSSSVGGGGAGGASATTSSVGAGGAGGGRPGTSSSIGAGGAAGGVGTSTATGAGGGGLGGP